MFNYLIAVFSFIVTLLAVILLWDVILKVLLVLVLIPAPYFIYCLFKGMYLGYKEIKDKDGE